MLTLTLNLVALLRLTTVVKINLQKPMTSKRCTHPVAIYFSKLKESLKTLKVPSLTKSQSDHSLSFLRWPEPINLSSMSLSKKLKLRVCAITYAFDSIDFLKAYHKHRSHLSRLVTNSRKYRTASTSTQLQVSIFASASTQYLATSV